MQQSIHRMLVVGVGSIGERHVRCFQATGRVHIGIVEPNPALRQTVAERYRIGQAYADLDASLQDAWQAAVVATPAHTHVPIARRLVDAGLHVLIEKPLSIETTGVASLQDAAKERGVTAAVAYVYRAGPALAAMRDAIQRRQFGEPVQLVATCGQHFPTFRPAYQSTYYARRESGGGAVQDALTHVINAGEWLVGPVTRVVADVGHQILAGVEVEDTAHVLARHQNVMGCYSLNQHQAPNEAAITVICQRGTARWEAHMGVWKWMVEPNSSWTIEPTLPVERDTLFCNQAGAFLDSIEGRQRPLCSLEEGLQTLESNRAILASASTGTWRRVPGAPSPEIKGD